MLIKNFHEVLQCSRTPTQCGNNCPGSAWVNNRGIWVGDNSTSWGSGVMSLRFCHDDYSSHDGIARGEVPSIWSNKTPSPCDCQIYGMTGVNLCRLQELICRSASVYRVSFGHPDLGVIWVGVAELCDTLHQTCSKVLQQGVTSAFRVLFRAPQIWVNKVSEQVNWPEAWPQRIWHKAYVLSYMVLHIIPFPVLLRPPCGLAQCLLLSLLPSSLNKVTTRKLLAGIVIWDDRFLETWSLFELFLII